MAIATRRFAELPRVTIGPTELRRRTEVELDRALAQLRAVHQAYWERDWRREHRGGGRHPEHHLWEVTEGYLDLLDAARHLAAEGDGGATA